MAPDGHVEIPGAERQRPSAQGLNTAIPEAQYIALPKLPVMLRAVGVVRTRYPVTTLAIDPVLVSCGWLEKPGAVTEIA